MEPSNIAVYVGIACLSCMAVVKLSKRGVFAPSNIFFLATIFLALVFLTTGKVPFIN